MVDFLLERYRDGMLSDAQAARFFDNALKLKLEVRRLVGAGDQIPFRITGIGCTPIRELRARTVRFALWVDDQKSELRGRYSENMVCSMWSVFTTLEQRPPGKHKLRIDLELHPVVGRDCPLDVTCKMQPTADFEVAPHEPSLKWRTAPGAAVIASCISINDLHRVPDFLNMLAGEVVVRNPPVNLAFDVFARAGNQEYSMGAVSFHGSGTYGIGALNLPSNLRSVDIVLRSSDAEARKTVEITEIWQGEIHIPNVPVQQPAQTPATAPGPGTRAAVRSQEQSRAPMRSRDRRSRTRNAPAGRDPRMRFYTARSVRAQYPSAG